MNKFTSKYCYVLLYTYIAYIQTYKHHAPTPLVLRQCRSYYTGTTPMRFLLRCH